MKRCKFIVNRLSGNAKTPSDVDKAVLMLKERYEEVEVAYIDEGHDLDMKKEAEGYDALAVTGGDGTLNSAVNAVADRGSEIVYIPSGTLNDVARSLSKKEGRKTDSFLTDIGQAGDKKFVYVLAGGIFTEIGYLTDRREKKAKKFFAYLSMVLRTYKLHRIRAKITVDGEKTMEGEYTLIMAINSPRCFGFNFNKRFVRDDGKGQLLLIKRPQTDGLMGKITVFFPLFRTFFLGLRRERAGKYITFCDFSHIDMTLGSSVDFTVDGEKLVLDGENIIKILRKKLCLSIV